MIMVLKQRKIKFFISRIKLNHNICIVETIFLLPRKILQLKKKKIGTQRLIRKNEGLEDNWCILIIQQTVIGCQKLLNK